MASAVINARSIRQESVILVVAEGERDPFNIHYLLRGRGRVGCFCVSFPSAFPHRRATGHGKGIKKVVAQKAR